MQPRLPDGVRRLFRLPPSKSQMEREIDEEMSFHIAMRAEKLRGLGLSPDSARAEAKRRFGDPDAIGRELQRIDNEADRDRRRVEFLGDAWRNIRHSVRALVRTPAYSVAAVITLALGIGANTAVFSVVNGVLLSPLPYKDADRIAILTSHFTGLGVEDGPISGAEMFDVAQRARAFEEVGAFVRNPGTITGSCGTVSCTPERIRTLSATASVFKVFGTQAALGRGFVSEEDVPGRDDVVVLDDGFWRRRFGADPGVIGSTVTLDGVQRVIVGVMPGSFAFQKADVYVPLALRLDSVELRRSAHNYIGIARLTPATRVERANAEVSALAGVLQRQHPGNYPAQMGFGLKARTLQTWLVGDARRSLLVLFGAVSLVLLIACVNVANLSLARAETRQREVAVRAALGAGRGRLIGELLTESLVLALAGSALGLLLANRGLALLLTVNPRAVPRIDNVHLDATVLLVTLGFAVVTGILFGLFPAVQATRTELQTVLRDAARGSSAGLGRQRTRKILIVAEVALSLVVLSAGALVIRSFWRLQHVSLGFRTDHLITMQVSIPATYSDSLAPARFFNELTQRVARLPDVHAAAAAFMLPTDGWANWDIDVEGRARAPGEAAPSPVVQMLTPQYFEAMGIPLVQGRLLNAHDNGPTGLSVVVNETMARRLWPNGAIGKRFKMSGLPVQPWFTVVGVVGDAHMDGPAHAPEPEWMITHETIAYLGSSPRNMWLLVRTSGDPTRILPAARRELWAIDRNVNFDQVQTMDRVLSNSLAGARFTMVLLACFAFMALALAAIGVYGVVTYTVAQRTREFGVRMAVGASARDVVRLVIGQGLKVALNGVVLGVIGALLTARLLQGILFETRARDPIVLGAIALLLIGVALLASYLPARRATRVDPAITLKAF
jgi:putative ABC transport system permease protein